MGSGKMRVWSVQPPPLYLLPTETNEPPWRASRGEEGRAVAREARRAMVEMVNCMVKIGGWN
jgi:hypothetical protein